MHDMVWLLGRGPDTATELIARLRETAASLLAGVDYSFEAEDGCLPDRLPLEFKRHLLFAFKEAVHNASRHAHAKHVVIRCRRAGRRFQLEIRDDGCGFDPETVKHGTGLRSLQARAAAMKGSMDLESQPGKGVVLILNVPAPLNFICGEAMPDREDFARVWLIEDNDAYRQTVMRVINDAEGMSCPAAFSSCEEALAAAKHLDHPNLVLLDVGLPGMSGLEGIPHLVCRDAASANPGAHGIRGRR